MSATDLPGSMADMLERLGIPKDHLGLAVVPADGGPPLHRHHADKPFNPASVMKLLPALAALEMLTPAYTWETRVYAAGPVVDGILGGDLYIQGGGDPYLTIESYWALLRQIKALGISTIDGDIVLDRRLFLVPDLDTGAFDGKPYRIYNGPPDALLMNFWAVRFTLIAYADGVSIRATPDSDRISIVNKMRSIPGPCTRRSRNIAFNVIPGAESVKVVFSGTLSRQCQPVEITRAVLPADDYVAWATPVLWAEGGGRLNGRVRSGEVPTSARSLFSYPSRSLAEIVRAMNKYSNNLMARNLMLSLGTAYRQEGITVKDGVTALEDWLIAHAVDISGLSIDNGSGLSRSAAVTPQQLIEILAVGLHSRYAPEFLSSLPVAGQDYPLKQRSFEGEGTVRVKTGLIDHVSALAGYVTSVGGDTYLVALLINHPGVHGRPGKQVQNQLIQYLLKRP